MSVQPTKFVIEQLQKKAVKFKEFSDFFEFLLNSSAVLESVSFKLQHNKDTFQFLLTADENSELVRKALTQFFADTMDAFFQRQKEQEFQIQLLDKDKEQDNGLLN